MTSDRRHKVQHVGRTKTKKNGDCVDWRKTCTFHQIGMWQLLYVWNALVLIAVPLGGERGTLLMGCHDETREKGGLTKQRHGKREKRCKWESKWVREEGIRDGGGGGMGNRDGAIFQAIYCNHHSLINQAFHHRTTQSLLFFLVSSLGLSLSSAPLSHPLS